MSSQAYSFAEIPYRSKRTRFFTLTKPEQNNVVAILEIEPNGVCTLNPKGWGDYGPIPPLNKLGLREADLLWGPAESKKNSDQAADRIYGLVFSNSKLEKKFHLDVIFKDQLFSKYRFRCETDSTIASEWRSVQ